MAIIDTDKMVWSDENRQQQALITHTLSRQPDLRLLETLPLKQRYDAGEHTPELYDEIMQCE